MKLVVLIIHQVEIVSFFGVWFGSSRQFQNFNPLFFSRQLGGAASLADARRRLRHRAISLTPSVLPQIRMNCDFRVSTTFSGTKQGKSVGKWKICKRRENGGQA